jgi:hypothetical protein
MDITFQQPRSTDLALVIVDGAVVGGLTRRELPGRMSSKSFMSLRHVRSWTPIVRDVEGLELDDDDRHSIERHITRSKTSRKTAADHLIEAYEKAGVSRPQPPSDQAKSR